MLVPFDRCFQTPAPLQITSEHDFQFKERHLQKGNKVVTVTQPGGAMKPPQIALMSPFCNVTSTDGGFILRPPSCGRVTGGYGLPAT